MYGTSNVEIKPQIKFIRPGIEEVTIVSVEGQTDTDRLVFNIKAKGEEDDSSSMHLFYMNSEAAINFQSRRIKEMGVALTGDSSIDDVTGKDIIEYGKGLNKFFGGKTLRMKFKGVERMKEDKIVTYAQVAPFDFVESTNIPAAESRLTFNKDKDIEKVRIDSDSSGDDLPFGQ